MTNTASQKPESHILVIDDQPEQLRALIDLLSREGFKVSQASDPKQGLQRALALAPDLILLDVHMPHMDGFTVCRLLREEPRVSQIPIIFLTSAINLEDRLQGLSLGGVDYVLKPCVPAEVLARIRVHLKLRWREPAVAEPDNLTVAADPDQLILQAAIRLITNDLEGLPSLVEIARQVGTHDKRLSSIFRRHLGMTVFAFVREQRVLKGQELLAQSHLSMQDIAELTGFSSACNFTTAFRERVGMTPSEYRSRSRPQG